MASLSPPTYDTITNSAEMYDSKPLFGVPSRREYFIHWGIAGFSVLFIFITFICSFVYPTSGIKGSNVFFCLCLILLGLSHLLLIYWYRQGDLDPKFLRLIYFNVVIFNLLVLCATLAQHV